jgi:hypothetical protein
MRGRGGSRVSHRTSARKYTHSYRRRRGSSLLAATIFIRETLFGPRNNGTKAEGQATSEGVPSNVETQSQLKTESEAGLPSVRASQSQLETEPASAGAKAIRPVAQSQLGTENLLPAVQAKTPAPVSAPNAVNQPRNNKDHAQGGIASAPASPSVVAAAKPAQSQVGTGPSSQPEAPKVERSMYSIYSDEERRNPYAIGFDFRLPGCRR